MKLRSKFHVYPRCQVRMYLNPMIGLRCGLRASPRPLALLNAVVSWQAPQCCLLNILPGYIQVTGREEPLVDHEAIGKTGAVTQ